MWSFSCARSAGRHTADRPPIGTTRSCSTSACLLVSRHGCNTAKEIEATQRQFAHSGLVLQGAVLNAVPPPPFTRAALGVLTG